MNIWDDDYGSTGNEGKKIIDQGIVEEDVGKKTLKLYSSSDFTPEMAREEDFKEMVVDIFECYRIEDVSLHNAGFETDLDKYLSLMEDSYLNYLKYTRMARILGEERFNKNSIDNVTHCEYGSIKLLDYEEYLKSHGDLEMNKKMQRIYK